MITRSNRLWLVVFLLGWLFDFLFWQKTPGLSFFIFTLLCLGGAFTILLAEGLRPAPRALILIAPILFFAALTFIRVEPLTAFVNHALTLFALSILPLTFLGGRWLAYSLGDYIQRWFDLIGSMIVRPLAFSIEARKQQPQDAGGRNLFWPIARGLLIALPVVAIFAALLSEADLIFAQRLEAFMRALSLENLPEYIFRLIYISVIAYALAGVILHASSRSKDETLLGIDKSLVPTFFGFTEAVVILGSVILLFAAFVTIQFQYFFGGQANIHLDGFTYSEYARRGFGELVIVAFISLLLFLSLSGIVKRESETQQRIFSGLGTGLIALVMIMLVSAFQRLTLYEAAYGFSRLRTYTHVFMIWLALLLIAVIALDFMRKQRAFALAMLIAILGFGISLNFVNVDGFIVRQNVDRAVNGAELDVTYLANLSDDAIPALANAYADTKLSATLRDQIGAALACYGHNRASRSPAWQSFNWSKWQADRTLAALKGSLAAYDYVDESGPGKATTPLGAEYECIGYYVD
jgi:hypothetical protein